MATNIKKLCLIVGTAFLSGCASSNDVSIPFFGLNKQTQYINAANSLEEKNAQPMARWWSRINDPLLDGYVEKLLSDNLSLRQASERVVQARENVSIQTGSYFPQISGNVSGNRSFVPGSNNNFQSNTTFQSASTDRIFTNSYTAELQTSWELDLFGKIRNSVKSADKTFQANLYDLEALKHTLIADLTKRRIAVAVQKNLLNLAKQNAENRKGFYDLVKRRYDLGAQGVSLSDVFLAEENYTSVKADTFQFERQLAEESYALDVLLGQLPGTTNADEVEFPIVVPSMDAPICLPFDLLDRRPDLKASQLRMAASKADISVAIAELYPSISLGGNIGFTGETTNNLFTADQLAGSILGNIVTRLFEGGRLRANIRLQESEAREQAALYAENILNAVREVETALKADQELAKELQSTKNSIVALRKATEISDNRYSRGIETLQNLLDTQQRTYLKEQEYLLTQQIKWNTRVNLYLALGGDWFNEISENANACTKEQKT